MSYSAHVPMRPRILVINPNSSRSMTKGLDDMLLGLDYNSACSITTYTAPHGPSSINNEDDALQSAQVVMEDLRDSLPAFAAILVACYSVHPLVGLLRERLGSEQYVLGIFEASISIALSVLPTAPGKTFTEFGIVTTGAYWEHVLSQGVLDYLGCESVQQCKRFAGVESTGLSASELHSRTPEDVRLRMTQATKRLLKNEAVRAICLGCAGMAGMDTIIRTACVDELGKELGNRIHIVDGVQAGVMILDGLIRSKASKS